MLGVFRAEGCLGCRVFRAWGARGLSFFGFVVLWFREFRV